MTAGQIGKYSVLRKLGQSASCEVYLCHDPFNARDVAVKRIFPDVLRDAERARVYHRLLLTEAALIGKLVHPHIVQVFDAVLESDSGYLVMEYVPGGTLEPFAVRGNLLPVEDVIEIVFKCTRALAFANAAGVTHRDIKTGNILRVRGTDIKVSDFGAALGASTETTQVLNIGSPAYMSPEQVRDEPLDFRTDVYSLGVVMYQLLCGALPFQASTSYNLLKQIVEAQPEPLSARRGDVPVLAEKIVRRAMQRDRELRYQSWDEFSYDLIASLRADRAAVTKKTFGDTENFDALRSLAFFRQLSDAEVWEILKIVSWRTVAAETEVMREGEPGDFFCVLAEGSMRVSKRGRLINVLQKGECFGEMAYLAGDERIRHASVTAVVESRIVCVRATDLEQVSASGRARIARQLVSTVVNRLALADEWLAVS
jgi:serine/threonine protein kinase